MENFEKQGIKETEMKKIPESPIHLETLDLKRELKQLIDPKLELPQTQEEWGEFYVLDEYWEKRIEEAFGEINVLSLIAPAGKDGRNIDQEKAEFFRTLDDPESSFVPSFSYPQLEKVDLEVAEKKLFEMKKELKDAQKDLLIFPY